MTMGQPYTCPIHNNFPRSVWTSVIQSQCFHETKSCYCCILQTTERKAPGISKAVDSAETPSLICEVRELTDYKLNFTSQSLKQESSAVSLELGMVNEFQDL